MFFKCQRTEGWFFWHPPACFPIYGNVYPPHWSIGREGGDSGFRRSRIWILVSRNKVVPLPPPPASLPSIPLPLVPEAKERMSQCSSLLALELPLQWDSGCVRGSESQRRASSLWGLTSREYLIIARANGISAPRPWVCIPNSWLAPGDGAVAGSTGALTRGVDRGFPRGLLLMVGFRVRLCEETCYLCVENLERYFFPPEA